MECPDCGRYTPPDPDTGYDADDLCSACAAKACEVCHGAGRVSSGKRVADIVTIRAGEPDEAVVGRDVPFEMWQTCAACGGSGERIDHKAELERSIAFQDAADDGGDDECPF